MEAQLPVEILTLARSALIVRQGQALRTSPAPHPRIEAVSALRSQRVPAVAIIPVRRDQVAIHRVAFPAVAVPGDSPAEDLIAVAAVRAAVAAVVAIVDANSMYVNLNENSKITL
jgi:hypothetical protein